MSHFPKLLSSQIAFDVARTMLDGFDKHYRLFREAGQQAKARFEAGDWQGLQQIQRDRIDFYNERVRETSLIPEDEYDAERIENGIWQQIKLHYIGLLTNHHQPELAETFFNSVCTRLLHRSYFNNDFIFVRPAISTEYIENEESPTRPTYRAYYPGSREAWPPASSASSTTSSSSGRSKTCRATSATWCARSANSSASSASRPISVHVLSSLFFRHKTAFIIGRVLNGDRSYPLVIPIVHGPSGGLALDAVLLDKEQVLILFSFSHSYFWSTWRSRRPTSPSCVT